MRWRPAAVLLVVLAASAAGVVGDRPVLVVADADTGTDLLAVPVHDGSEVTLTYTHSVEKTPVEDTYTVDGTSLDNTRMRFKSYGWGLPAGANVTLADGWFVYDPGREYDAVTVQPAAVAGHELVVDGERFDLVALAEGDAVTLAVERRTDLAVPAP